MWGIQRFARFGEFFEAGQTAGFTCFELNHGVDSAMLESVHLNGRRITSVHEPCPSDVSVAELKERDWLISAIDEADRRRGVEAVRRSIDLAHDLGARVVIVHSGRVNMDESLEAVLTRLYKEGKRDTPAYEEAKSIMMAARSERAAAHLASVRRSLGELARYAAPRGVRLGVENRDHYFDIPLIHELDELLASGFGETVGYWHDIGHAEKSEYKGYSLHEDWLTRFADRMIGVHLHDIIGMDDHLPVGYGEMRWNMVARHLPTDILRTCEFRNASSAEQIADGLSWLAERGLVTVERDNKE